MQIKVDFQQNFPICHYLTCKFVNIATKLPICLQMNKMETHANIFSEVQLHYHCHREQVIQISCNSKTILEPFQEPKHLISCGKYIKILIKFWVIYYVYIIKCVCSCFHNGFMSVGVFMTPQHFEFIYIFNE